MLVFALCARRNKPSRLVPPVIIKSKIFSSKIIGEATARGVPDER